MSLRSANKIMIQRKGLIMNKVIMHINYAEVFSDSYGKKTVDDICRQAAEIGFDGIESNERYLFSLR